MFTYINKGEEMRSLSDINIDCKTRLSHLECYELIEKIIFNEEETKEIGNSLKKLFQYDFSWETIYSYKELISIFLVSCAKYYYNDGEGGFWQSIQNLTDIYEATKRQKLIKAFNTVLSYYKLNKFKDYSEESYKNIKKGTVILYTLITNEFTKIQNEAKKEFNFKHFYDKAPSLFNARAIEFFYELLAKYGIKEVNYYSLRDNFDKHYGYFII